MGWRMNIETCLQWSEKRIKGNKQWVYRNSGRKQRECNGMEAKAGRNFKKEFVMNNFKSCRNIKEGVERKRNHCNHFLLTFES